MVFVCTSTYDDSICGGQHGRIDDELQMAECNLFAFNKFEEKCEGFASALDLEWPPFVTDFQPDFQINFIVTL